MELMFEIFTLKNDRLITVRIYRKEYRIVIRNLKLKKPLFENQ